MSKLRNTDFMQSTEALKDFKLDCIGEDEYRLYSKIIILDGNEVIYEFEDIEVFISLNYNYHHIDIIWEDKLKNYKNFKLYGRYRTDYNLMEYSYKELKITSDNITLVIRG